MSWRVTKSPLIAGIITLLISIAMWQFTLSVETETMRGGTFSQTETFAREAQTKFLSAEKNIALMIERFGRPGGFNDETWDFDSAQYLRGYPSSLAITWVDEDYIIRKIMSDLPSLDMVGTDARIIPGTEAYLEKVKAQDAVVTNDIFQIKGDGIVAGDSDLWTMIMYAPFYVGDTFKGFVGSTFNIGAYFSEIQKSFPNLHIRICANGGLIYTSHSEPFDTNHSQYWFKETTIGNTVFQVEATPTPEYDAAMSSTLPNVVLGFGLILTLLISWLVHNKSVIKGNDRLLRRQALALSQASDAMMIYDNDQKLVGMNAATTKLFGYSESEFSAMTVVDLVDSPSDLNRLKREWQASMDFNYTWRDTVSCRTKDGRLIQVSISETRLEDENGKPLGSISMSRDVTEEYEKNVRLQVSEKRFRRLFESNYHGIAIRERGKNGEVKLIEVNQAYLDMVGYSFEELQRFTGYELSATPEDAAISRRVIAQLKRDGFVDETDITYRRKDGSTLDISAMLWKILGEDGEHFQTISMLKDNTARKRAEDLLEEAQHIAKIGSWELDLATGLNAWSPEIYSLLDRDTSTAPDTFKKFSKHLHPDDRSRHEIERKKALAANTPFIHTSRIIMNDGSIKHFQFITHTELNTAGTPTRRSGTIQDVTQQKELEERLRHSENLQSLGQLTGGVAHDFNNILGIVSSTAHFIQMDRKDDSFIDQNMDRILRAVTRGAGLTDKLLSFSRKQRLDAKDIETKPFMSELGKILERTLGRNIRLDINVAPEAWAVHADENQLTNAILNLALNGRDAIGESGHLTIDIKNVFFAADDSLPNEDIEPGGYVAISVSDNGCGMPADVLEKAFEPFFTTKDVGKGSGLGLSMVHGFAEQSNGAATIHSELGVGTRVTLYLPGKQVVVAAHKPRSAPAVSVIQDKYTVLIVEDQPELRLVTDQIIRRLGYKTLLAGNAEEALAIANNAPDLDAAFLDVLLPGGANGTELAERLRTTHPDLKIMFTTGYAAQDVLDRLDNFDHSGVFRKPLEVSDLAETLITILNPADRIAQTGTDNVITLDTSRKRS